MTEATEDFQLELVKVLLRVAWADHRLVRTEADMIRDLAHKLGISAAGRAQMELWLQRESALPAADIALLKRHKRAVLAAVRALVVADDSIAPEEATMLSEIEAALA